MAKTYKFHNQDKSVDIDIITDGIGSYDKLFINDIQGTLSEATKLGLDYVVESVTETELMQKAINTGLYLTVYDLDNGPEILNIAGATLVSPEDAATDVAVAGDLEWEEVYGADEYDVYLWEASGEKPASPTSEGETGTTYSYTGLTAATEYSWQIVAKSGDLTSESVVRTFTTAA